MDLVTATWGTTCIVFFVGVAIMLALGSWSRPAWGGRGEWTRWSVSMTLALVLVRQLLGGAVAVEVLMGGSLPKVGRGWRQQRIRCHNAVYRGAG